MSKSSVSRELQTQLEPELLRGITLDHCLSGWAKNFVPPDPGMFKVDHSGYNLSKQIQYYDEFLSHDWQTSRWYKLCAMLVIYNSKAAFVCTFVVSLSVGILRATHIVPNELWTQLLVLTVFPLVLCFWQRLRSIIARPKMVFLDKLCIAQHDEELKQKGIFGLAGFLDHSRQLTILWSHRYFSRLWCTYEVATFLRAEVKPILVIPVKLAVILCLFAAAELFLMLGYYVSASLNLDQDTEETGVEELLNFLFYFSVFYLPTLPLVFYIGIGMIAELKELPQQLRDFRVQDAKCFCCSCHHRHPETGDPLPCDRELMFQMLKKWFGQETDRNEEYLEVFNRLVHEKLAPRVLQDVGYDVLPFNYSVYMVIVGNLPQLCTLIPALVAGPPDPSFNFLQHTIWMLRAIMDPVMVAVVALGALRFSLRTWLIAVRLLPNWSRLVGALLLPIALLFVLAGQWLSFQVALRYSEDDSLLPAIPLCICICGLYCLWTFDTRRASMLGPAKPVKEEVPPNKVDVEDEEVPKKISTEDEELKSTFST